MITPITTGKDRLKYLTPQMEVLESKGQINDRIKRKAMKKYEVKTKKK